MYGFQRGIAWRVPAQKKLSNTKIEYQMKSIKKLWKHSLCILLACVLFACDADKDRASKIGSKSIMTDKEGNWWLVKHEIGAHYSLEYLGDSTLYAR